MRTLVADEVKSMEQLIKTLGLKGAAIHRPRPTKPFTSRLIRTSKSPSLARESP